MRENLCDTIGSYLLHKNNVVLSTPPHKLAISHTVLAPLRGIHFLSGLDAEQRESNASTYIAEYIDSKLIFKI